MALVLSIALFGSLDKGDAVKVDILPREVLRKGIENVETGEGRFATLIHGGQHVEAFFDDKDWLKLKDAQRIRTCRQRAIRFNGPGVMQARLVHGT